MRVNYFVSNYLKKWIFLFRNNFQQKRFRAWHFFSFKKMYIFGYIMSYKTSNCVGIFFQNMRNLFQTIPLFWSFHYLDSSMWIGNDLKIKKNTFLSRHIESSIWVIKKSYHRLFHKDSCIPLAGHQLLSFASCKPIKLVLRCLRIFLNQL